MPPGAVSHGRISALALTVASLGCVAHAAAQGDPGAEIRGDALRVFLDCNTFPCDSDYFRTDVEFVNWVRRHGGSSLIGD